jgi:Glutathione S-transferase, N-terminal domain
MKISSFIFKLVVAQNSFTKDAIMSKKLPIILYHNCVSPPSRMALLAVRNMGLEIEVRNLDIYKGEQNTLEYLKVNPLHQVRNWHANFKIKSNN